MKLKFKSHEKIIFLFLVFLLSYSLYSLSDYVILSFNKYPIIEGLPEGITDEDDVNLDKVNYEDQLKTLKSYKISTRGGWNYLEDNVKGLKTMVEGITLDQNKSLKKSYDTLGVKYPVNTGYKCVDPYDESHDLYTYVDNTSQSGVGLIGVIGDAVDKQAKAVSNLSSAVSSFNEDDKICKETTLRVKTNSGVNTKQTVHIDEKEIENIDSSNIVLMKNYPKREEDEEESEENEESEEDDDETETFVNINKLLMNDDLFYKDYFIFTYFFMLSLLFLYYIFIIVINN